MSDLQERVMQEAVRIVAQEMAEQMLKSMSTNGPTPQPEPVAPQPQQEEGCTLSMLRKTKTPPAVDKTGRVLNLKWGWVTYSDKSKSYSANLDFSALSGKADPQYLFSCPNRELAEFACEMADKAIAELVRRMGGEK